MAGYSRIELVMDSYQKCIVKSLKINGKEVAFYRLGYMKDLDTDNAPPGGCGNRVFIPDVSCIQSKQFKDTYGLSDEDANSLKEKLVERLHIGKCPKCR